MKSWAINSLKWTDMTHQDDINRKIFERLRWLEDCVINLTYLCIFGGSIWLGLTVIRFLPGDSDWHWPKAIIVGVVIGLGYLVGHRMAFKGAPKHLENR